MAKGDDVVRRKKNKAGRKKLRSKDKDSSSSVSARVAAIIAAKKRRQSGKRRKCQGMCFSLPTPDDPFNDRSGNKDFNKKEVKVTSSKASGSTKRENDLKDGYEKVSNSKDVFGGKRCMTDSERKVQANDKGGSPSKFLVICLNAIGNAMHHDSTNQSDRPRLVDRWGVEFWKCYSSANDILDTSGSSSTDQQIAWVVSSAADSIARKEKEGLSFSIPFLLFLVPTQEKAIKVRSLCKPLKALGVHTVSIHPGATLDHQIQGLKSCMPEFLVSTPERLLELVARKAIDISGVSLLVVDGPKSLSRDGYLDMVKSIRNSISGNLQSIVFSDSVGCADGPVEYDLLKDPIHRLPLNISVATQVPAVPDQ